MDRDKKNSLWLALQYGLALVLSLVGLKLNLLTFGASDFSIWILLLSIWGVGAVLDLGFGISIVRFIARKRDDAEAVNHIVSTGFIVFLLLGLLIVGVGIGVAELFYLSNPALVPPEKKAIARAVQLLLAANFYSQYIGMFFRSVFEGAEEFALPAKLALVSSLILFALTAVTYALRLSLIHLGAFYCIASGSQIAAFAVLLPRYFPAVRLRIRNASYATFREIFSFSMSVQATFLLGALIDPVIKFFLGTFSQRTLIPPYEIARRFTIAVSGLFSSAFRNNFPKASVLTGTEEYQNFLYHDAAAIARKGIIYAGIFFGFLSFVFSALIVGFYGFQEGVLFFFILALTESVNLAGFIVYVYIVAVGKAAFLTFVQALNIITVSLFLFIGFNIAGPAMALLGYFCAVVTANITMLLFVRRQSGFSIGRFLSAVGIEKLIMFQGILLAAILCLRYGIGTWYMVQAAFSIVCAILFVRDALKVFHRGRIFLRSYVMAFFQ